MADLGKSLAFDEEAVQGLTQAPLCRQELLPAPLTYLSDWRHFLDATSITSTRRPLSRGAKSSTSWASPPDEIPC